MLYVYIFNDIYMTSQEIGYLKYATALLLYNRKKIGPPESARRWSRSHEDNIRHQQELDVSGELPSLT